MDKIKSEIEVKENERKNAKSVTLKILVGTFIILLVGFSAFAILFLVLTLIGQVLVMKKWPFIVGGAALAVIVGGLITFIVVSRNAESGVKEFTIVDTWKATGKQGLDGSNPTPILESEYYVFKADGTYDYYYLDNETPLVKGERYSYDMKQNQLKLYDQNHYYTLERKSNNVLALVDGNSLKEFIRWGNHSKKGIDVPTDPFGTNKWEITFRHTNRDYKGQYLTFIDGKMSLFDKNDTKLDEYNYVKEDKAITIGDLEKVLTIYPYSEETIYLVESAGQPGYTWELTKKSNNA